MARSKNKSSNRRPVKKGDAARKPGGAKPKKVKASVGRKSSRSGKTSPPIPTPRTRKRGEIMILDNVTAGTLIDSPKNRDSVVAWFNLYMTIEVGDSNGNTFKAKAGDLSRFLSYFRETTRSDHPDQWTISISKSFLTYLLRAKAKSDGTKFSPSTVNRILATVRSAARWIHRQRPFLAGFPMDKIRDVQLSEPEWKGLEDVDVTRLRTAADQLPSLQLKAKQQPLRDKAILLTLLGTALRVSELLSLDLDQYQGKHFRNVKRKGNNVTAQVFIPQDVREILDDYITKIRGKAPGPLFQSKTGRRLAPQNIGDALNRIGKLANSRLGPNEQIHLHPHVLRHTALRKMAEKKGIRFAQQMAGHASTKYIWRYIKPSSSEMEQALENLYD